MLALLVLFLWIFSSLTSSKTIDFFDYSSTETTIFHKRNLTRASNPSGDGLTNTEEEEEEKLTFHSDDPPKCYLIPADPQLAKHVHNLIRVEKVVIIEYTLNFVNYSSNPLKLKEGFQSTKWFRTSSEHGHVLLNLAFNYGILSMETLTLGTAKLNVSVIENSTKCLERASGEDQLYSVQYLLLRDFNLESKVTLAWKQSVCRKVVVITNEGFSSFAHECVTVDSETSRLVTSHHLDNTWISVLNVFLVVVRVVALTFLPCVLVSMMKGLVKQKIPYVVKLNSFLQKTVLFTNDSTVAQNFLDKDIEVLDLNKETGFPRLKELLHTSNYKLNECCLIEFEQYDVLIDYHRTQPEDNVSVGFTQTFTSLLFRCKIKELGPFKQCCDSKMISTFGNNCLPWITFWRKLAAIFLVLVMPFPYYIRLFIYYIYEHEEIVSRKTLINEKNLRETFEGSFLHYWTPIHPVFISIYIFYVTAGLILALAPRKNDDQNEHQVLRRIVNSFRDLDAFSFAKVVSYVFSNFTYPFYKYGILGCFACFFYWLIALPLVCFVCLIYSIPSFYLIFRMIHYGKKAIFIKLGKREKDSLLYQVHKRDSQKKLLDKLKIETLVESVSENSKQNTDGNYSLMKVQPAIPDSTQNNLQIENLVDSVPKNSKQITAESYLPNNVQHFNQKSSHKRADCWICLTYISTTILCILAFCCALFILAELTVFLVQIVIFTIMGIIVNANYILRHVMVLAIILIYCFDSFTNMEKKYSKMNKMLFAEVTNRIKNLDSVTSLPSYLQENRGFKSQELNEQAHYENSDAVIPKKHWLINDLVLFMDSEDTPRIPKKLFKEVCGIKVPGVPGPIYQGQLDALTQLAKVMFFVFLVVIAVMIFNEVYSLSSTNQLIATVAGSFLPLIFRTCIFHQSCDIEVNSVAFKCHLDELIKLFRQNWPIHDMEFKFVNPRDEEEHDDSKPKDAPDFVICLPKSPIALVSEISL